MKPLPFPKSLPEFQRLFLNDAACSWWGVWARGGKADGTGNVYVRISKPDSMRTPAPSAVCPLDYVVVHPAKGEGQR